MKPLLRLFSFIVLGTAGVSCSTVRESFDVVVAGGGASGVCAGVQAARMGADVLLTEETDWLGGMLTAAGVSAVDGNDRLPAGLWGEFRERLASHYGGRDSLRTGWVSNTLFEPSVGNTVFHQMAAAEKRLTLWKQSVVLSAGRRNGVWRLRIQTGDGHIRTVKAKALIDATELGDIAAMCGAGYDIGMESRQDTREDIAPEERNGIVQDLTYVAILKDYGRDVSVARPDGYTPAEFACCCDNANCLAPDTARRLWQPEMMMSYGRLPNNKYMINWPIEGNDTYLNIIEMSREEREEILVKAKQRTMRFLYFLQHELGYNRLGLANDEFPTADRLPLIPYHRESRRIHGLARFTLRHIMRPYEQEEPLYRTNIAVGDYPVDHHHSRYEGGERLPDLHFHPVPSYGLPLGTLLPRDVDGLIVAEKSVSVSNIVNGTTRLQPVVMQIGQAAGAVAALAVRSGREVRDVPVRDVQNAILDAKGYLQPYLDVAADDRRFMPYQRIGSTGILKSVGRNAGWANERWLRADTALLRSDLDGLWEYYPYAENWLPADSEALTQGAAVALLDSIVGREGLQTDVERRAEELLRDVCGSRYESGKECTRGEFAVLLDGILDPFNSKEVDIHGRIVTK